MTQPWWGKEARPHPQVRVVNGQPELLPASRAAVMAEIHSHIAGFTPDWTNFGPADSGRALIQLFSEQSEPVLQRLNLLPRKAQVEFLNITGATNLPATPAEAMLEFTVADGATESVLIARGFQVSAPPATGQGDRVVFETEFDLYGAPAKIAKLYVKEGGTFLELDPKSTEAFRPFGDKPIPGRALLIGLSGAVAPSRALSLGIGIAAVAGTPAPVASGGIEPIPVAAAPLIKWEILDGASYEEAEVIRDETGGFFRSGIVDLGLPRNWRVGCPEGLEEEVDEELRWLRLRIAFGQYEESPRFSFIKLNMTRALAARTIRDEILEPVADSRGRQFRLSQTPVLPGLVLEIDDGGFDVPDELDAAASDVNQTAEDQDSVAETSDFGRRWTRVDDLSDFDSEAEVYLLDPETGIVSFGDGVNGKAVPRGFRNVRAASYRVGGGEAGAVEADSIKTMLSSVAFVSGVKNPLPASGGTNRETQRDAVRRGPQEFRARGRAVTVADYALMAMRVTGAQVLRAHALSGFHPSLPGRPIPGVVGVYVVPPDRNEGPPTPDDNSLRAVSETLSEELAPLGIEVVAAAPRYHRIGAVVGIVVDPSADAGATIRNLLDELNTYLHPLKGGDDGNGWPFGGTLSYSVLIRHLLARDRRLLAIPTLNFVVDERRVLGCEDVTPAAHALFWPEGHQVIIRGTEGTS